MSRVEYSPQSLEDLKLLQEYISASWGENVSKKILTKITSDIRRLELFPVSGVDLAKIISITTDYRYLYSEKNYVFYRLELDRVLIVRVLNDRQDYLLQLFGANSTSDDEQKL